MELAEPVVPIISRSLILMIFSISVYAVLGFWVSDDPEFWHSLISNVQPVLLLATFILLFGSLLQAFAR
jgi:hypothetical protein